MNKIKAIISMLIIASISSVCIVSVGAENEKVTEPTVKAVTAEEAVKSVVKDGIESLNIKSTGSESQIGIFSVPENIGLPFNQGILLSTGNADEIFKGKFISKSLGGSGNDALQKIYQSEGYNNSTYDAVTLSFDIVPSNAELSFDFFFASTEYNQAARYNDVFALWIIDSETGERFNVAKTPFDKIVNVQNTVTKDNSGNVTYKTSSKYYNYVDNYTLNNYGFSFLGYTTKFTADGSDLINSLGNKVIQQDKPVTIEFAITDCGDSAYDSAIFIRCDSVDFKASDKKLFEISYDTNKLSDDVFENVTTGTDGTLEKLPVPNSNNDKYTFAGWYTQPTGGEKVSVNTVFEQDTTLYAHWTSSIYTIKFDSDGGIDLNDITYTSEDKVTIPYTSKSGYDFEGWKVVSGNGSWEIDSTINANSVIEDAYGDVTLKAIFKEIPTTVQPIATPDEIEETTTPVETQKPTEPQQTTTVEVQETTSSTQPTTNTVNNKDNSTVQTGTVLPTLIILVVLASSTVLLVFIRRKSDIE